MKNFISLGGRMATRRRAWVMSIARPSMQQRQESDEKVEKLGDDQVSRAVP